MTEHSPAQLDRLDGLRARFTATTFEVLSVDPFSRLAIVEAETTPCPHCGRASADADGFACDYCRGYAHRPTHAPFTPFAHFAITAGGLNVPDRIACGWASTH